ncbi:helix-turn-helix domain-containing protein [Desertibacillus haloalkaliphilus]|uniref:helix-turn-helix domain-containing protein n=1 Tax=Desertibacillus haloalkaliphilus TaxID=1328930 RepID=UPI001C262A91|nr:helix-turn-helix transcriptional regulator [Desertibacillus haloalkaliphilus]MBU8905562.1 helix-turn-helix domain-containing protein [Desertibacillus haloalkaliphilus]
MLSQRLRQARKIRKLTQEELAKKVNTKKTTISNYETGYSSPSNDMLSDLANALSTSTDYLLGRSDDPSPKKETATYDPLAEINKVLEDLGIENIFFHDMDAWKHFTPEDVEELKRHFEWVAHKAKERNKEK